MKNIKKIICLDNNSTTLSSYSPDLRNSQTIVNLKSKERDKVFIDMAICNKTERIGCLLRDNSISFWEHSDGFQFEKNIKTNLEHLQVNIWCIDSLEKWVTTDKSYSLYIWEIEGDQPLVRKGHKQKIMDIIEVGAVNAMVSSSLDKTMIVWNLKNFELRFKVDTA